MRSFARKPRLAAGLGVLVGLFVLDSGPDLALAQIEAAPVQAGCDYARLQGQAVAAGTSAGWAQAAECAAARGDAATARDAFLYAYAAGGLGEAETLYVLRSIGFQAEAANDPDRARWAWHEAAARSGAATDALRAARAARLAGDPGAAQSRLWTIDEAGLSGPDLALLYEERGRSLADTQPREAALWMARAIAIEDAGWRQFEMAGWLERAGDFDAALAAYEAARRGDPDNAMIALSTAYAYRRAGRNAEAAAIFAALAERPGAEATLREEQGYALAADGRRREAAQAFRFAIDAHEPADLGRTDPERLFRLQREVETLERSAYARAFIAYRDDAPADTLGRAEQGSFGSLAGVEAGWRPEALYRAGRGATLYARASQNFEDGTLQFADDALQLGVGVRWKPFESQDFSLAGERLVAGGDLARDAWLLRASWGWTQGGDWNPTADRWVYTSLYGDLAWIPDEPAFTSAYASARHGLRFRTGEGWALTPYLTAAGQISDDSLATRERLEAGVGLMLSRWSGGDRYRAYPRRTDFELEVRAGVGDTSEQSVIGRVVVEF